jgi:hypothetical protein
MPGLDPGIHLFRKTMDCRVEPGNDGGGAAVRGRMSQGLAAANRIKHYRLSQP